MSIAKSGVNSIPQCNHGDIKDVQVITHNQIPVVTTEMLADFYGSDLKNLQMNHLRNTDRFEIGKHFFKLEGDELRQFKNQPTNSGSVQKRASSLILWTERGAARHAKMLETDKAWEVFEQLEECYFNQKKQVVPALPQNYIEALECLVVAEKEKVAIALERDHAINTKAEIGSRREATAMAKASVETRRANKLAKQLGECVEFATVKAVENKTKKEYPFFQLRKYCKEHGLTPNDVPDKTYGTVKAWPSEAWLAVYDVDIKAMFSTKAIGEDAA